MPSQNQTVQKPVIPQNNVVSPSSAYSFNLPSSDELDML